jgi:hypothetical protein
MMLLGVAGSLSQAIYLAATVRLPWFRYGREVVAWKELLGRHPGGFGLCIAAACALTALYLSGWWTVRQGPRPAGLRWIVWGGALVFAGTLVWLMPVTSDLFTYVARAHLFTDLGTNPLLVAPVEAASDPLLRAYATSYSSHPAVYGPAWILLSAPGTTGANDFLTGVVYLKCLVTIGFLACAFVVERILRSQRPEAALEGLYLFSWNPLVLWMTAGDGHNDIVMMAAAMLGILWLLQRRWAAAAGALAVSVWIKYVSLVFVPLVFAYGLGLAVVRTRRQVSRRTGARDCARWVVSWQQAAFASVAGLVVSASILTPFWPFDWIPAVVRRLAFPVNWQVEPSLQPSLALGVGLLLYGLTYVPLLRGMFGDPDSQAGLLDRIFVASLMIFVLGVARSQPWHLLWPASLAGLSRKRWAWPTVAALSVAMLLGQVWVAWGAPGWPLST